MGKGKSRPVGSETVNKNGYTLVKTSTGWRMKHHLKAEEKLGRPLESDERVRFADNDRTNFDPDNLMVAKKQIRVNQTYDNRRNTIEDRVMLFVEEATDKHQALEDIRDILNDARLQEGFGAL